MDPRLEQRTLDAEDRHWWYRGRRAIVLDAVARALGERTPARILDAGCGGGGMLGPLARFGEVTGTEPSPVSRERAESRGETRVVDGAVGSLPFESASFDLVLALDVIEHIADDGAALADLRRVTAAPGALVVTVPAHPRMWSRHDQINDHHRRYSRRTLTAVAEDAGWRIELITHFNALLLPVAAIGHKLTGSDGFQIPPVPVNRGLEGVLHAERLLIGAGIRLPFGLSILAQLSPR